MARGKYLLSRVVTSGMQGHVFTCQRVAFEYCNPFSIWLNRPLNGPDTLISRIILSIFFAYCITRLIQPLESPIERKHTPCLTPTL